MVTLQDIQKRLEELYDDDMSGSKILDNVLYCQIHELAHYQVQVRLFNDGRIHEQYRVVGSEDTYEAYTYESFDVYIAFATGVSTDYEISEVIK